MTRSRTPVRGLAAFALVAAVAGCTGSSGGPDGGASSGPRSGGGSSGTAQPTTGASSSQPGGSTQPTSGRGAAPARPLRTATIQGAYATYSVKVWAERTDVACATHARGAVATFLTRHKCNRLERNLSTTMVNGRAVGIARSTVRFAGSAAQTAVDFSILVAKDGAGEIDALFRDGKRLPSGPTAVPDPDAFTARNNGATVTSIDAWYLSGRTPKDDPKLLEMAESLAS